MSQILISKGNGKMLGINSINSNPLFNDYCEAMSQKENYVCNRCYSRNALKTYRQSANNAWHENGRLLSNSILPIIQLPYLNAKFIRISSHGELINDIHVINLMNIVNNNPQTTFSIWSKRLDLLSIYFKDNEKPENLIVIYSNPIVNKPMTIERFPAWVDKVFNVVDEETVLSSDIKINCNQKCLECQLCYTKNSVTQVNEWYRMRGKVQKMFKTT